MERTNIRYVTGEDVPEEISFFSIDVAFISLRKVLEPVKHLLTPQGRGVCLVKPQFEAGREKVGKKGVVRDKKVHEEVISQVMGYALSAGFQVLGLDFSPVKEPEGNIEYLLYLENAGSTQEDREIEEEEPQQECFQDTLEENYRTCIQETVDAAHIDLV